MEHVEYTTKLRRAKATAESCCTLRTRGASAEVGTHPRVCREDAVPVSLDSKQEPFRRMQIKQMK
eukprot:5858270-Pleurochrysis_carterae.AAC.1